MSENNQNFLTKVDLAEWAEKVFLPAFEKILESKLEKYLGTKKKIPSRK